MKECLFLFLIFFSGTLLGIEDCPNVRLEKYLDKIPLYNQQTKSGDSGTCYAISASILADAYRLRSNPNEEKITHPQSVALYYKTDAHETTKSLGGGYTHEALKAIKNQRVCDGKWIDSFNEKKFQVSQSGCNFTSEDSNLNELIDVMIKIQKISFAEASTKILDFCADNSFTMNIPLPQNLKLEFSEYDPEIRMSMLRQKIRNLLERPNALPIGIVYDRDILLYKNMNDFFPFHASVLMGQIYNKKTKSCDYLIRDTYGACEENKYVWPCEKGIIQIPSSYLLQSLIDITWLD